MEAMLQFETREAFRAWLVEHCLSPDGVWLLFGKASGPKTLTAAQALEEALCFGWIDGQMQRIDGQSYRKYFAQRRPNSNWSDKNKALAQQLEQQGRMTDYGRAKIAEAQTDGRWEAQKPGTITPEQIEQVGALLQGHEPACSNFQAMSPSVKKTYARAYFDAKTQAGREKRLAWMVDRLDKNLKPM